VLNFPVVLFDTDYWPEMLDWINGELLADGMISPEDVELLYATDSPAEAVQIVVSSYDVRAAPSRDVPSRDVPSPAEPEKADAP